jgi:MPBQ/MSBQ methyltransferase
MNKADMERLEQYLRTQYAGVCSEEQIQLHIKEYVGMEIAAQMVDWMLADGHGSARILDIGSGFGSFVLLSREKGIDAIGIEIAEFEVEFARKRLQKTRKNDDPLEVYVHGDACKLPFPAHYFEIVTLWNVLEHIKDVRKLLHEVNRVLYPKGHAYVICPNYAAFRQESHYHIAWFPILPPLVARIYLKMRKKNPKFFDNFIFYRTNWGIISLFARCGFTIYEKENSMYFDKLSNPETIRNSAIRKAVQILGKLHLLWIAKSIIYLQKAKKIKSELNPFKNSVVLHLQKKREI